MCADSIVNRQRQLVWLAVGKAMSAARTQRFGELLRSHRQAAGLTQEELAARATLSVRAVGDLERGAKLRPHRDTIHRLVAALRLSDPQRRAFERAARSFAPPPAAVRAPIGAAHDAAAPHDNLPAATTSFIGRERELEHVRELLRGATTRLLTLTGSGGSGKTRLALEAAGPLLDEFADGVYLVNLAPLAAPDLVLTAVARTLGVQEPPGQPLLACVTSDLREKQMLLLLDNFEHLLQAAPLVSELLALAPRLKVLATSRVPLHLRGEQEFMVPPLALPDVTHPQAAACWAENEAVQLFVERTSQVQLGFGLTAQNGRVVAEIVRRLDGLPLAIELAAAQAKMLGPQALLARLSSRLAVLTGGSVDLPARQQTLRKTIEWSYDLLSPPEQCVFARLAVFAGGCTLEAAEAVCGGDRDPNLNVFAGLAALVDKNLLHREERPSGEPRLLMLETIREYAREKLAASAEAGAIGRQHARYFVELVERVEPELRGPEQVRGFDRLEEEQDNIRGVFAWCRGEESGAEGAQIELRLVGALSWYWYTRGPFSEGRARARAVLARPEAQERTTWRVRALRTAVILAWIQGDFASVRSLAEEGLPLARELGDRLMEANFLNNLGHLALEGAEGDLAAARALYEQCLAIQRELGNRPSTASALINLSLVDRAEGDLAAARPRIEEALAIVRELGDTAGIAYALQRLGELVYREGNYPLARAHLEQALALRREMGEQLKLPEILDSLGHAALREGDYDTAAACFRESLTFTVGTELGSRRYAWVWIAGLAVLAGAQRQGASAGEPGLRQAAKLLGASEGLRDAAGVKIDPPLRVELDRDIAAIRAQLDEETWRQAWEEGRAMSMEQAMAEALQSLEPGFLPATGEDAEPGTARAVEPGPSYPDGLTTREVEVLRLIAIGRSNQEIAAALTLSLRTVERHISNIYQKIGATGTVARASATTYAHRHGLAD
jgi:predicted ATPase/DNA-binding CsgD family transcriptional regulator/DNA-binding XRE family transcriptional regulator